MALAGKVAVSAGTVKGCVQETMPFPAQTATRGLSRHLYSQTPCGVFAIQGFLLVA
jgi:hypothetical protein